MQLKLQEDLAAHGLAVSRDQLLCELELQQTISAAQIQVLDQARQDLEESRNLFTALYQQSPIGYVTLNARGCIEDSNCAASALLGLTQERLRLLPFTFAVCSEDAPLFFAHLERCRNSQKEQVTTNIRLRGKSREIIHARLISVPFEKGLDRSFLTGIVDLTERSQSEQTLAEAKEFSESIVETVRQPLVVVDGELRIVSVNRAFTEFFKVREQYARGWVLDALLNLWWSGNRLREELQKVLVKNQPLENFKIEIEPRNIGKRILLLNARRLNRKAGSPSLILMAMEDITARKQAEEELHEANLRLEARVAGRTQELQRSYEQMEAFCYSIAHDLRAPLRSMTGFSSLLIEDHGGQMDATGKNFAERIRQSAGRMDELIRDLLNYGRLNTAPLATTTVDLEKVFQEVLAHEEKEILEKGAKVRKNGKLPVVQGHHAVCHAVLANLISNALKFVPPNVRPQIAVSANTNGDWTRVWVADNGIGIAPENRGKIFGVFQRLHSGDHYPGTGIGLAIVEKGVERMGGRIGLESEPGKGSRFWFELARPNPRTAGA